ncbi:MAG TPA: FAD-dependent oxidoreductase [Symbiobacteriaceae bacterium]
MRLVIIGGGAAGMSAAAQARRTDPGLEIVVLEQSEHVSTGLCGLPYFVAGLIRDASQLVAHTPEYFRQERRIDVRTGHRVEAVNASSRTVTGNIVSSRTATGNSGGGPFELRYDRLVVATGAKPVPLDVPGADRENVFYLRTVADGIRLRASLEQGTARRAAVIGGGFIGVELAEALRRWKLDVTVIEQGGRLLPAFDPWISDLVAQELRAQGVTVLTNHTVAGLESGAVQTRQGGPVAADLTVVAVGSRPDLDLLKRARPELGRTGALAVSRQLQTSLPFVWAAGDCAESRSAVTGRAAHVPLGTVANLAGRVAGEAAAGRRTEALPLAGTYLLQVFDLAVARTGLSEAEARAHGFAPVTAGVSGPVNVPVLYGTAGDVPAFEVRLTADARTGRLLGAQLAGHRDGARRIDVAAALLTRGALVRDAAGLDLGYTPPLGVARDPLVQAAQRLLSELDVSGRR